MDKLKAGCAGLVAAGIVFMVCRWVVLPLTDEFRWVQHLGMALAIGGAIGLRSIADDMAKGFAAIAAVVCASLAVGAFLLFIKPVPAHKLPLAEKKFPGITMKLPAGTPAADNSTSSTGGYKLDKLGGRKGFVEINWQPGRTELSPSDFARLLGIATSGASGQATATNMEVSGHAARRMSFPVKRYRMFLTAWYCDQHDRDFTLATAVFESHSNAAAFHDRIVAGVQCHVGDKPRVVTAAPLVTLPPSYGRQEPENPVAFRNLDGGEMVFQAVPDTTVKVIGDKPALVLELLKISPTITQAKLDGPTTRTTALDGSGRAIIRVSYMENQRPSFASVTGINCGSQQSFLALHAYTTVEQRAAAEAVLLTAQCQRNAPAQTHPTVTAVFSQACDARDARGCYYLGALAANAAPPNPEDAKRHYTRGCDLDHAMSCNDLGVLTARPGTDESAAAAKTLYDKACTLGEKLGCDNAGR